jgi:hypothetical protein
MSATTHVPPQNIEAEESVLGAMLVAEPTLTRVIDEVGLRATDFYLEKHRAIFEVIHKLHTAGKPVDELSVSHSLKKSGKIEDAGGRHYVSELAAKVPAAANAKHYAEIVSDCAEMRRVGQGLQEAMEAYATRNGDSPQEIYQRAVTILETARPEPPVSQQQHSWRAEDLLAAIEGRGGANPPAFLSRSDGPCLLYEERLHQLSAEPEAGKGWLACRASADLLQAGRAVIYIDFEDTAAAIVERLQALGAEDRQIAKHFIYIRPHEPLTEFTRGELDIALGLSPALVVIDGVTEALTIHGLDLGDNGDIARWLDLLPRPAVRSGAAVLMLDHVVKDKESRGRYAIGAQHKLAGIDVAYALEVIEAFGRGKTGLVKVRVTKDRPGHVRPHSEGDQIALMRLGSSGMDGRVDITLDPPDGAGEDGEFRPTVLMERISSAVEANPGMTAREIRGLGGKASALDQALHILLREGYLARDDSGRSHSHTSVRPFRAEAEEASIAPW